MDINNPTNIETQKPKNKIANKHDRNTRTAQMVYDTNYSSSRGSAISVCIDRMAIWQEQ